MSTYVPPHNLTELYNACLMMIEKAIKEEEVTISDLVKHIKGPDFPDGGSIISNKDLTKIFETGKGKVVLRSTYEIKEHKKNQVIWITELPYQVNQLTLVNKIEELASSGIIEGVKEVIDESDKNVGVRIAIYLKKDANVQMVVNQLLKRTDMQKTINYNIMTLIEDKKPAQLGIKECLEYFLQHCMDVITRRTQFDYDKAYSRAHLIEGINLILHDIDNAIHIIRNSESPITSLIETFKLSKEQAEYIYEMKIKSLSKQSEDKLLEEYNSLQTKITEYTAILNNQTTLLNQMAKELIDLRDKFGDERRTIIDLTASSDINEEDLIKDETLVVTITSEGNIKSVEEKEYNTQKRGGKGSKAAATKDDEVVTDLFTVNSKDDILFITNTGRCHIIKAYKLPKVARTAKGKHLNNFLSLTENEYPVSTIATKLNDESVSLLFATLKGKIKRLPVTHLSSRMSSTKVIGLADDDAVVKAITAKELDNVLVTTALGQGIRIEISETCSKPIRPQGRTSKGVSAIKCKDGDIVVGMTLITDESKIFGFTSNGLGKSTKGSEYPIKGRGGQGVKCHKITERTGYLIGCLTIEDGHDIFVGTESGQIIRLEVEGLAISGRDTSGTKLINLSEGDSVFTASLAPMTKEDIEDVQE